MAGDPAARLARLTARLTADRRGILVLDGIRTVLLPVAILNGIAVLGQRVVGDGISAILYLAGAETGEAIARRALEGLGEDVDRARLARGLAADVEARGFGRVTIVDLDLATGVGTVQVDDNPLVGTPGPDGKTACRFAAGFWAGLVQALSGRSLRGEETTCEADGGAACEFVTEPEPAG